MSGVKVFSQNLTNNPKCPHGPTLLFSKVIFDKRKKFYSCSAYRDRQYCNFLLFEDEAEKMDKKKQEFWDQQNKKYVHNVNHTNLYLTLSRVLSLPAEKRMYCHECSGFQTEKFQSKHKEHDRLENVSNSLISNPSTLLKPLDNAKTEAQYLFTENAVKTIVGMLKANNLSDILCIGAPKIHEYIINNCPDMSSLLLDLDKRYLSFYGPLQCCWYNMFNHYFFLDESKQVFRQFLCNNGGKGVAIVTDPPFGGRVEPIAETLQKINKVYQNLNQCEAKIPIFWTFPYFSEPYIKSSCPDFSMLDYKVDYDNHPLFSDGPKGRKLGSPVRIFTNLSPSLIALPAEEGYKYCKKCKKWVSEENVHCKKCKFCTSKDGRTYVHCDTCERCVKPTWTHCSECGKCALPTHKCHGGDSEEDESNEEKPSNKTKGKKKNDRRKRKREMGGKIFMKKRIKSK